MASFFLKLILCIYFQLDLEEVDLSVPLRPDEVIPVHKHHNVVERSSHSHRADNDDSTVKKSKKSKRDRVKALSDECGNGASKQYDLLGINMDSHVSDFSSNFGGSVEPLLTSVHIEAGSMNKKVTKRKSFNLWSSVPVVSSRNLQLLSLATNGDPKSNSLDLTFQLINHYPLSTANSISLSLNFNAARGQGKSTAFFDGVKAGASAASNTVSVRLPGSFTRSFGIPCTINKTVENLMGLSESSEVAVEILVNPSVFFLPFQISEEEFSDLMSSRGRSKGRQFCGSASDNISIRTSCSGDMSSKQTLKAIAAFLGGHVVRRDGSAAISTSSKTPADDLVCALAKISRRDSSDEIMVHIDVKYMTSNQSVDANISATNLIESMRSLILLQQ